MTRTDPIQCDIHLESQVRPLRFFKPDLGTLLAAAGASIFDAKSVRFPLEPRLPPILPPPLPFARLATRCWGDTARAAPMLSMLLPEDLMGTPTLTQTPKNPVNPVSWQADPEGAHFRRAPEWPHAMHT